MINPISFEEELNRHGRLVYTNTGTSMMPLLRQQKDLFIIEKKTDARCKKYDAVLYKRGKTYILHRVLKVTPDGYVICGDHCVNREYDIKDEHILGIMTGFVRDGKETPVTSFTYRIYVHVWCDFFYIRAAILRTKAFLYRVRKKFRK